MLEPERFLCPAGEQRSGCPEASQGHRDADADAIPDAGGAVGPPLRRGHGGNGNAAE